jgi:predicted nucleic acid-binding protein
MPFYHCDASGLVKRYVDEVGSAWVRAIVAPAAANIVSIADITRAEVISAFARRAREGVIAPHERDELIQTFRSHCATQYRIVPTQPGIVDLCGRMMRCSWLPPVSSINH